MIELIFCTIVPCILGLTTTLTVFCWIYELTTGVILIDFVSDLLAFLDSSDNSIRWIVLISLILIVVYVGYSGLIYIGNFKFLVGEPENTVITYNIVEVYNDKLRVTVDSSDEYSFTQILMEFWNFILLPICAYIFITLFGWLVFIIQARRVID